MRVDSDGLYVPATGEHLTTPRFAALCARGEPFALKVDYRGLPPPLEELDLVWLTPAAGLTLPSGTLVLRTRDDAMEFARVHNGTRVASGAVARVVTVERPRTRLSLESRRWQLLGALLVRSRHFARAFAHARGWAIRARRAIPPEAVPLRLARADEVVRGVAAKYAEPGQVRYEASRSAAGTLDDWEADLAARMFPPGGTLLVVGCGAGREALGFARLGFHVTGIDLVPALAEAATRAARDRALDARFEAIAPETLAQRARGAFDVVICAAGVYEQTPRRAGRVHLLGALRALTAAGGLIVLSAGWHRDRGPRMALIDGARWVLGRVLRVPGIAEPGDRFTHHVSVASHHATMCFFHMFQTPHEIEAELAMAGLAGPRHPDGPWVLRRDAER